MRRFDLSIPLAAVAAFMVFAAAAAGVLFAPVRWQPYGLSQSYPGLLDGPFGAPTLALGFGLAWLAVLFLWSLAAARRRI
jgi:hypothetical protein